jgi:hypothetical protein
MKGCAFQTRRDKQVISVYFSRDEYIDMLFIRSFAFLIAFLTVYILCILIAKYMTNAMSKWRNDDSSINYNLAISDVSNDAAAQFSWMKRNGGACDFAAIFLFFLMLGTLGANVYEFFAID